MQTYKVKTQPGLGQRELVQLLELGCSDTAYQVYPEALTFRAEATPEQCEKLKALPYVLSVEEMPVYRV